MISTSMRLLADRAALPVLPPHCEYKQNVPGNQTPLGACRYGLTYIISAGLKPVINRSVPYRYLVPNILDWTFADRGRE